MTVAFESKTSSRNRCANRPRIQSPTGAVKPRFGSDATSRGNRLAASCLRRYLARSSGIFTDAGTRNASSTTRRSSSGQRTSRLCAMLMRSTFTSGSFGQIDLQVRVFRTLQRLADGQRRYGSVTASNTGLSSAERRMQPHQAPGVRRLQKQQVGVVRGGRIAAEVLGARCRAAAAAAARRARPALAEPARDPLRPTRAGIDRAPRPRGRAARSGSRSRRTLSSPPSPLSATVTCCRARATRTRSESPTSRRTVRRDASTIRIDHLVEPRLDQIARNGGC